MGDCYNCNIYRYGIYCPCSFNYNRYNSKTYDYVICLHIAPTRRNMKKTLCFRFTLVHRFTLERVFDVYAFGYNLVSATRNLRKIFPSLIYDVEDVICCSRLSQLVIVGYSTLEDLL